MDELKHLQKQDKKKKSLVNRRGSTKNIMSIVDASPQKADVIHNIAANLMLDFQ